jgi:hypothetical protein
MIRFSGLCTWLKRFAIALVMALLMVGTITDSKAEGPTVIGLGTADCELWTGARPLEQFDQFRGWLFGFLSAANGYLNAIGERKNAPIDLLRGREPNSLLTWVDTYCLAHPREKVHTAAGLLVSALMIDRVKPPRTR